MGGHSMLEDSFFKKYAFKLKSKGYVAVSGIEEDLESVAYAMNGEYEELKEKKKQSGQSVNIYRRCVCGRYGWAQRLKPSHWGLESYFKHFVFLS